MNFDLGCILAANCFLLATINDILKLSLSSDHFSTPLGTNISPTGVIFEDYFPFPKAGYVSSLEGNFYLNYAQVQLKILVLKAFPKIFIYSTPLSITKVVISVQKVHDFSHLFRSSFFLRPNRGLKNLRIQLGSDRNTAGYTRRGFCHRRRPREVARFEWPCFDIF